MKPKKLEDLNKENIFQVPEDYFEKLPLKVQERVSDSNSKSIRIFSPKALRISLPSLTALSIALVFWLNTSTEQTTVENALTHQEFLSEFSQEEVSTYILSEDIAHYELTEAAENNDLELNETTLNTSDIEEEILELDIDLIDVQTYL